jgi:hypothetical protein
VDWSTASSGWASRSATDTKEFRRCVNWQHWGPGEYVTALEPANGTVEGRARDRERGLLDTIPAGGRKVYRYQIEAVTGREGIGTRCAR